MGRGRQKAKATKQARDMKYFSPATDLSALERELAGNSGSSHDDDQYIDYADKYADYVKESEEDDDPRTQG
ncbi:MULTISPECIES: DUF3073 domain-containing protein [Citricoccus]|uniref:DUF3073 family protein n=3 Tax=Citricoccus TaxID=169133 RepID=A0A3D9LEH6_9MICC|nr:MULTISPECIES: DUF3073 domain-containing protein [Citricoccus]REE04046.1 hypothetical protein C8E99_1871 [Citricoccus muralis]VXB78803.1 conserved hypothetical protein [Citricoccus sp. K5]